MSSWGPVFLVSRRAPSSRLTWVAKSSWLRGESWAGLSPRRREAREENAKGFSLVAALLLCVITVRIRQTSWLLWTILTTLYRALRLARIASASLVPVYRMDPDLSGQRQLGSVQNSTVVYLTIFIEFSYSTPSIVLMILRSPDQSLNSEFHFKR